MTRRPPPSDDESGSTSPAVRAPQRHVEAAVPGSNSVSRWSHDSERMYRLLVESVRDYAIFMLDPLGYVATWNEGAARIKGYAAHEIVGRHFSTFYPQERVDEGFPQYELVMAAREGRFEDEAWRLRKDGTRFWANVVITALRDERGELVGYAKVTRDLTERKRAEERAIEDARRLAAAEASSRVKSEFLASMSHELRTPLNAIGGFAELLEMGIHGPLSDAQREDVARIRRSQQHLLGIINDILNFSRIEAGKLEYEIAPLPLAEVVDDAVKTISPLALKQAIALEARADDPGVTALADRPKVEQILLNLLSNAVKFTPEGGRITVAYGRRGDRAVITVVDTGRGVPEHQREEIFEPFVQLGRSFSAGPSGTGLGLAISRDLARAMQGELDVTEAPGGGAAFTLQLPAV
jgi:PAS domain S-box-containing protein